jgi:hypothetical protein
MAFQACGGLAGLSGLVCTPSTEGGVAVEAENYGPLFNVDYNTIFFIL